MQQVKAVLCAALYPNAAVMDEAAGRSARPAWNDGTADVHIHPSSINHPLEAHQFLRPYLVYLEKVQPLAVSVCFGFRYILHEVAAESEVALAGKFSKWSASTIFTAPSHLLFL